MSIVSDRQVDDLIAGFVEGLNAFKRALPPRAIGDLLNTLMPALDADGWEIADGSVDETGLTVKVDGILMRLCFRPEAWLYPTQEAYESVDRSSAFLGEIDPAGFNGMESPDVAF
jgi:hypothetical protein